MKAGVPQKKSALVLGVHMLFCSALLVAGSFTAAVAETISYKKMRLSEGRGALRASSSFTELFDSKAYQSLESGVATTIELRVALFKKGVNVPTHFHFFRFRIVYDLWEEEYVLQRVGSNGRSTSRYRDRAEVLKEATQLKSLAIAPLSEVAIGPHHFLMVSVQLNPIGKKQLQEVRRWLARTSNEGRLTSSSSFFGSVVSVFSNAKLAEADRTLRYRSQPFFRVKR